MTYLRSCLLGVLISLSTSYIILTLSIFTENRSISGDELLHQLLIAIVMGIIIGLATTIYVSDKLSFTVATIIHFTIVTLVVMSAGIVGQWFDLNEPSSIMKVFINEVIAYLIIWGIIYILMKREVEQLNTLIQERRRADEQYRSK
ncbi:DUF3021 domain-containing protein [Lysinibacillus sp. LZ02]|uniref:DUF3021 domain-containing protein n=1 Tax=Lysinibacillus sp. LZ02 TaxID=3420668 RepID=UPI003D36A52D